MSAVQALRLRVQLTKHGRARFLSHAEYFRAVMMSARRSGLPLVYSGEYRPRMKISFSPPIPIGVTSECELVDLFIDGYVPPAEAERMLSGSFPEGIELVRCRLLGPEARPVGKLIDTAEYRAYLPPGAGDEGDWRRAVEDFIGKEVVNFERVQPRRTRVVNIRAGVHRLKLRGGEREKGIELDMVIDDGTGGTVKPFEVLAVLGDSAGLNAERVRETRVHRTGLFVRRADRLVSPMDLGPGRPAVTGPPRR